MPISQSYAFQTGTNDILKSTKLESNFGMVIAVKEYHYVVLFNHTDHSYLVIK